MYNFLMSVVWNKEQLNTQSACIQKITPERLILLIFRVLSFLRRDREIIQLLLRLSPNSDGTMDIPFPIRDADLFSTKLDTSLWFAIVVWIMETCPPKAFLIALICVPANQTRAVVRAIKHLVESRQTQSGLKANVAISFSTAQQYLMGNHPSKSKEQSIFHGHKQLVLSEQTITSTACLIDSMNLVAKSL